MIFHDDRNIGDVLIKGILKKEGERAPWKEQSVEDVSPKPSEFVIRAKTHEELEVEILSERVLRVLDESIPKLRVASYLPLLIEDDGERLKKYLSLEEIEFIVDSCAKYVGSDVIACDSFVSTEGRSYQAKFRERLFFGKDYKTDTHVAQTIDIIVGCKDLMNDLELMTGKKPSIADNFIEGVCQLRTAAANNFSVSAEEEQLREKELRIAWNDNIAVQELINGVQSKLDKQREELEVELNAKLELIESYKAKMVDMTEKFKTDVIQRITSSEEAMVEKSRVSQELQDGLAHEAKERSQEYRATVDSHVSAEKALRTKRFKVEAQLASWLAKYDSDIGERQTQLEELNALYDEEALELDALLTKFDEQEDEYVELMAERDECERNLNEERAFVFLRNRAVRRIQAYWRAYRERKLLRKRSKKGKKKKQSADQGGTDSAGTVKDQKIEISKVDPNVQLQSAFKGDILEDISTEPMPI